MAFKLWERFSQADNVFQALRPLTFISLLGLAPFRLNLNPRKEVQTSKFSFFAGIVHFLFFVLCFGISVKEGDSIIGYFFQTNITRFSDGTLRLTGILAMSTIFGFAMFKRQRLVSIIQNNIVVDEIFVRLGMKLDYRRILLSSFLISLGMLLFNVIYLCVSYSLLVSATISPSFVTFTTFALPHINISLMVFKFLCTTDLARSRFSMLNEVSVMGLYCACSGIMYGKKKCDGLNHKLSSSKIVCKLGVNNFCSILFITSKVPVECTLFSVKASL